MAYDPNLIITRDNREQVVLFLANNNAASLQTLLSYSNVELVNAYHEIGPQPTETQRATSAAIIALLSMPPQPIAPPVPLPELTHYRTSLVVLAVTIGDDVMLVGPAGCGKTTIGEHVAQALGLLFHITNTVTDAHELLGFIDGYGRYHSTPFRRAFECGGIWIADEIDAWEAGALLAANSALANGFAAFPDAETPIRRHPDFRMVATANTFGTGADRVYIGRNELDAASLDRFAMITVDYDLDLERRFAGDNHTWLDHVWRVRKTVQDKNIRHVVSSRAIGKGARALAAGMAWKDVCELYLYKGISSRDRSKLDE